MRNHGNRHRPAIFSGGGTHRPAAPDPQRECRAGHLPLFAGAGSVPPFGTRCERLAGACTDLARRAGRKTSLADCRPKPRPSGNWRQPTPIWAPTVLHQRRSTATRPCPDADLRRTAGSITRSARIGDPRSAPAFAIVGGRNASIAGNASLPGRRRGNWRRCRTGSSHPGMARGHRCRRACRRAGRAGTVAVMAGGADVLFPPENEASVQPRYQREDGLVAVRDAARNQTPLPAFSPPQQDHLRSFGRRPW